MKLIITGATGYVGKEVVRQSLGRPEITSVVAVARKPVPVPDNLPAGADASKLRSVVVADYTEYPDDVRKEFAGADACIWTVAITPTKARAHDFEAVKRVCQTSTLAGLDAMYRAGSARPFRFLYVSGATAERDQNKKPGYLGQYSLMRGETESRVMAFAAAHEGVEATAARPGMIYAPGEILKSALAVVIRGVLGMHSISVVDLSRVILDQVNKGFEKDSISDAELVKLAKASI